MRPDAEDRLLRGLGDGSFEDVTTRMQISTLTGSRSAAWADYDGDRYADLLVLSSVGTLRLERNLAGALFEERTRDAGLADLEGITAARFVDYDLDGFADLELDGRFFHNRGNGAFEPAHIAGSLSTKTTATPGTPGGSRLPLNPPPGHPPIPAPAQLPSGGLILAGSDAPLSGFTSTDESIASGWITPWVPKTSLSSGRVNSSAVSVSGKIYAIGGHDGTNSLATVDRYDPATNAWTAKTSMATARDLASAALVNGKIYVFGGADTVALAAVEEYDPATDTGPRRPTCPRRATASPLPP